MGMCHMPVSKDGHDRSQMKLRFVGVLLDAEAKWEYPILEVRGLCSRVGTFYARLNWTRRENVDL